jgi:hypothetical protein
MFPIDNSRSTQEYWSQVRKAFEILARLVKDADPNSMDLLFTNWNVGDRQKNRTKLLRLLDSVQTQGQGGLESAFSEILDRCTRGGLLWVAGGAT